MTRRAVPSQATPSQMKHSALLRVDDLRVHFRTKRGIAHAVDGVSFEIGDGETLGLVGETGCGKSVTARSLLRLVPVPPGIYSGGTATFAPSRACPHCSGTGCDQCERTGHTAAPCPDCRGAGCQVCDHTGKEIIDLMSISESRMREIRGDHIAMVFQDPDKALNPSLTVGYQIAEVFNQHRSADLLREAGFDGAAPGRMWRRDARGRASRIERTVLALPPNRQKMKRLESALQDRVIAALADTNIPNPRKIMNSYPHELSGGMKQRVMIAQAIACEPNLLIADEPTTALDVTIQARILDLIAELKERHRASVLYISHDLAVVRNVSDRVAVMYAGRIAEVGPTDQIMSDPLHPYTRGLLAASKPAGRTRGKLVAIQGTVPELIEPELSCRFSSRCPNAGPVCARLQPELTTQSSAHAVSCFLYEPLTKLGVAASEMPKEATL